MGERSDELTESRDADAPSTDDLLEETEQLLSETGGEPAPVDGEGRPTDSGSPSAEASTADADGSRSWWPFSRGDSSEAARTSDSASGRLSRLGPSRSLGEYFSPKAFLAVLALVSVGLFAGGTLLPIGALGRFVGLVAVTFLFGLLTSKRRYLELSVAGTAAGGLTTVLFDLPLAIAGSGRTLLAAGAAAGLVVSVLGYYFGRDLRDGLSRDIE
ncbi:DUF456 domain-containing protein [Natrialba sp. INN-245]|uniref:DUF456 domain-containing protein n=1 Tax=Natrialba sp. INN-245 TaxID=2690967 RepID=UPI0013122737|nr:DUF456 domain-containing protein [Natrialba sp. INN-245]MWV41373.1 DUF456 domain-containing protein [Natrialba sp. INN-245]